jgi:hypothetical protein
MFTDSSGATEGSAGVRINDIVLRVEGRSVSNLRQFSSSLFRSDVGGKLNLELLRGDRHIDLAVAFLERNDDVERSLRPAKNVEALTDLLKHLPDGSPLVIQVQRQGTLRYLVLIGD